MMLKKIIQAVFIFGLLTSQLCLAQYPLAWFVEKNAFSFWVYGLAHSIPQEHSEPPAHMQVVFTQARIVVAESYTPGAKIVLPHLTDQERALSRPYFDKLVKDQIISAEWGDKLRNMPTYEVYESLQELLLTVRKQTDQKFIEGYDAFFSRKAYAENPQKLGQLEDRSLRKIAWAANCGDAGSYLRLIRAVDQQLRFPQKADIQIPKSIQAALKGDLTIVEKIHTEMEQDDLWRMLNECSVIPRNYSWIKLINADVQKFDKSMIVIGYSHVVGKDNFIDLLRQHGFKATYFKPK